MEEEKPPIKEREEIENEWNGRHNSQDTLVLCSFRLLERNSNFLLAWCCFSFRINKLPVSTFLYWSPFSILFHYKGGESFNVHSNYQVDRGLWDCEDSKEWNDKMSEVLVSSKIICKWIVKFSRDSNISDTRFLSSEQ